MARKAHLAFDNPDDLQQKVDAYFQHCESSITSRELKNGDVRYREESPTMIGLAVWLGCNKETLYSYINMDDCRNIDEDTYNKLSNILACARDRMELALVNRALNGDCEAKGAAMILSNYGYSLKTETDNTSSVSVKIHGSSKDAEDWSK